MHRVVQTTIDSEQSTVLLLTKPGVFTTELSAAIQAVHLRVITIDPGELSHFLLRQENRVLFSEGYVCIWVDQPIFVSQQEKIRENEHVCTALKSVLRIPLHFISFDAAYSRKNGRVGEIPTNASKELLAAVLNTFPIVKSFEYQHVIYPYAGGLSIIARFIIEKIEQGKRFPFIGTCKPLWYADVITHIVEHLYDLGIKGGRFEGKEEISLDFFEFALRKSAHLRTTSGEPVAFPFMFEEGEEIGKTRFSQMQDELSLTISEPTAFPVEVSKKQGNVFVQPTVSRKGKVKRKQGRVGKTLLLATLSIFAVYASLVVAFIFLLANIRSNITNHIQDVASQAWESREVADLSRKSTLALTLSRFVPLPYALLGLDLPKEAINEGLRNVAQFAQGMQMFHRGNELFVATVINTTQKQSVNPDVFPEVVTAFDESYKDLSSIQAEISSGNPIFDSLFGIDGLSIELEKKISLFRDTITQEKALVSFIQTVFQKEGKTVIVFASMDTSSARPLFGVPSRLAVVTLDQGKITSSETYTAQQLDQLLKGKVETPAEFQVYGAPVNWKLSDGSWSADGPTAARQIAWFINKQLRVDVDTVVFLDSPTAAHLEAILPGGLSNVLGAQTTVQSKIPEKDSAATLVTSSLSTLINALNDSQMVIFSRDSGIAKTSKALAWDAGIRTPTCPPQFTLNKNCTVSTRYVAEYDLDSIQVGESSPIKENQVHKVHISRDGIVHTDSIIFAPSNDVHRKILKYYLDEKATVTAVSIDGVLISLESLSSGKEFEKTTLTVPVSIQAGSQTSVSIAYSTPPIENKESSLAFFVQKQPGKEGEPFSLEVSYAKDFIPTIIAPKAQIERSIISFSSVLDTSKIFAIGF